MRTRTGTGPEAAVLALDRRSGVRSVGWRLALVAAVSTLAAMLVPARAHAATGPPVEVIIRHAPGAAAAAESAVGAVDGEIGRRLGLIHGFAATVPADALDQLSAAAGVTSVTADGDLQLLSHGDE
jgi:hypothetical protein